eukprot:scaffold69368_cov63-Phaeocystis_antarctica.AAC.3
MNIVVGPEKFENLEVDEDDPRGLKYFTLRKHTSVTNHKTFEHRQPTKRATRHTCSWSSAVTVRGGVDRGRRGPRSSAPPAPAALVHVVHPLVQGGGPLLWPTCALWPPGWTRRTHAHVGRIILHGNCLTGIYGATITLHTTL